MHTDIDIKGGKNRRLERARAFQVLYGLFFRPVESRRELARNFALSLYVEPFKPNAPRAESTVEGEEVEAPERVITPAPANQENHEGFAWDLVLGVWQRRDELDGLICGFSQNWRLERMGRVELALLRLAIYELVFRDDVPPKVIINEAIELSKQFGDDNSRNFINGILDAAVKALDTGSLTRKSVFLRA